MTVRKVPRLALTAQVCADPRQLADALNRQQAQLAEIIDKLATAANDPVLHPTDASGEPQAAALYQGDGAPPATLGVSGSYYLRKDTPTTPNQRLYVRSGSTWTGIL